MKNNIEKQIQLLKDSIESNQKMIDDGKTESLTDTLLVLMLNEIKLLRIQLAYK